MVKQEIEKKKREVFGPSLPTSRLAHASLAGEQVLRLRGGNVPVGFALLRVLVELVLLRLLP